MSTKKEITGYVLIVLLVIVFAGFLVFNSYYKNFLLLSGFTVLILGIVNRRNKCPKKEIIYRNVPRTFIEEQENPILPSEMFRGMFTEKEPFIDSLNQDNPPFPQTNN